MQIPKFCTQPYLQNREMATLSTPYCQHNSLPSVSKLKPTLPRHLPYLDAFSGVVVPCVDPARRADMVRFLKLGWRPGVIAKHLHVSEATVYNTEQNLMQYGLSLRPHVQKTGRPVALIKADRVAVNLMSGDWRTTR